MNKNMKIIIVAVVALLVFTAIGVTYAYFTANEAGTESVSTIKVSGGTMSIAFAGTSPNINLENIVPQEATLATKIFTITGNNTTNLDMFYAVSFVVTDNTFSSGAISYSLTGTNTSSNGLTIPDASLVGIDNGARTLPLGSGNFAGKITNGIHTYELKMYFKSTEQDQNADQGKHFAGHLIINNLEQTSQVFVAKPTEPTLGSVINTYDTTSVGNTNPDLTIYSVGYATDTTTTSSNYSIQLNNLPLSAANISNADVINSSVMSTTEDFNNYVALKNSGGLTQLNNKENKSSVKLLSNTTLLTNENGTINASATDMKNHSATASELTINSINVECTNVCNATISLSLSNLSNITPLSATTIGGESVSARFLPIKFNISFTKGTPNLSGVNAPILADNMFPVTYDEASDVWKKADKTKTDWYDYDNQMWANAVTVTSGTRTTYNNAAVGTTISMDDIVGMWVWIPRYEYKIDHPGLSTTAEEIHVNFISGTSTTNTAGYLIHPTFRDGTSEYTLPNGTTASNYSQGGWDKELTGFWYGKFETGYASNFTETTGEVSSNILVKPNVYGMKYQNISNEYATAQNIQTDHGIGNQVETHMSKNDEWGAVAYLSQSAYGKYGNDDYTGVYKEVYVNNAYYSTGYIHTTGRSASTYSTTSGGNPSQYGTYEYNNCPARSYTKTVCDLNVRQTNATRGTGASTTGTIYGIYDMAAGLYESVMGVLAYNNDYINTGIDATNNSGFTGYYYNNTLFNGVSVPELKYYNLYTTSGLTTACNGTMCFGHGFSNETGNSGNGSEYGWYNDYFNIPSTGNSWAHRGCGSMNSSNPFTGIFAQGSNSGKDIYHNGFRVVAS